jgi:hypothetical protein
VRKRAERQLFRPGHIEPLELADAGDVDDVLRGFDIELHEIDERRAAGQEAGPVGPQRGHRADGFAHRCGPGVVEGVHGSALAPGNALNRGEDAGIRTTAAEIPAHVLTDFIR